MAFQTVEQGLASPQESVVSKKDLITGVLSSLKQQQMDNAASLYRRSKEDIGYELMNFVGRGDLAKPLADIFLQTKDFYKAAQVYEKLELKKEAAQNFDKAGAFGEAADLYASAGDLAHSAEMFERGGSYSRAAPLFEQAGQWLDAARSYEKAGECFLAGRAFVEGGDQKKALECLQKVQGSDASYAEAVSLLGPILEEMGFSELALQKYREATQDSPIGSDNISTYYRLARLHESSNQPEEAKQIYAKILERDLNYQDAQERYKALKEGKTPAAAAATPVSSAERGAVRLVVLDEDMSFYEQSVLFRDLTFDEMRSFLALAEKETFKAGELLLREGEPFPGLVLVRNGTIGIGMKLEGKDIRLRTFGPGDHVGEMTVQGEKRSRVTAVAETDGDCIVIPGERIGPFLERNPTLNAKILKNMMAAMDVHLDQFKEVVKALWARAKS